MVSRPGPVVQPYPKRDGTASVRGGSGKDKQELRTQSQKEGEGGDPPQPALRATRAKTGYGRGNLGPTVCAPRMKQARGGEVPPPNGQHEGEGGVPCPSACVHSAQAARARGGDPER